MLRPGYLNQNSHIFQSIQCINSLEESTNKGLNEKKLKKICSQFEAIFLSYLFRQMKKTIPESDFLKEEFAHRIYEEEFYTLLAEKLAEEGGIGLAKILYQELKHKKRNDLADQKSSWVGQASRLSSYRYPQKF